MERPPSEATESSSSITTTASSVSSATSGGFRDYKRSTVGPFILHDLEKRETCTFSSILEVLLQSCRADSDEPDVSTQPGVSSSNNLAPAQSPPLSMETESPQVPDPAQEDNKYEGETLVASDSDKALRPGDKLLDACLGLILNMCEDEDLRRLLKVFCETRGKGKPRYIPFVRFANYALAKLESDLGAALELKPTSDFKILFHVNDSKAVRSSDTPKSSKRTCQSSKSTGEPSKSAETPKDTQRIPDIVLVSLAAVQRAHAKGGCTYEDAMDLCLQPGSDGFSPREILATLEMKWQYDPMRAELPRKYQMGLANQIPPIDLSTMSIPTPKILIVGNDNSNDDSNAAQAPSASSIVSVEPMVVNTPNCFIGTSSAGKFSPSNHGFKRPFDATSSAVAEDRVTKKAKAEKYNRDSKVATKQLMEQTGLNAAQALGCSLGRQHCISLAIVDEKLWVWMVDRQGAIQSSGLNFVEDLPYFLAFLVILQRLDITEWGYNTTLDPTIGQVHTSSDKIPSLETIQIKLSKGLVVSINPNRPAIHRAYCLVSRATTVHEADSTSRRTEGFNLVAKLSWPDKNRDNETLIIQKACSTGNLAKHLPRAFGSQDLGRSTGVIRSKLGIDHKSPRLPRVLRIIIFEKLSPLTDLRGEQLLTAWVHCVRCHQAAWGHGAYHQDLSLKNLMYRKEGDKILGVVNDWDLSHIAGNSENTQDLTATIPFLSLQVLAYLDANKPIERCYYHDLESFFWILLWVVLFVEDARVNHNDGRLKTLETGDVGDCHGAKQGLLGRLKHGLVKPKEEWVELWPIVRELTGWLDRYESREERGDHGQLFESFIDVVNRSKPDGYAMPTIPSIL